MKIKELVLFLTIFSNLNIAYGEAFSRKEAMDNRLHPEADFNVTVDNTLPETTVKPVVAEFDPQKKYNTVCAACHNTGAAGAPKLGDKSAWAPRLQESMDIVYSKAIHGYKGMPPRGTCMNCSDEQIKQIVDYMVSKVK